MRDATTPAPVDATMVVADTAVGSQDASDAPSPAVDAGIDAPSCTTCGDASCVDTSTDPGNCGACGQACAGTCRDSRCIVTLASGQNMPFALATDGIDVYWTNLGSGAGDGSLVKVSVAGGVVTTLASQQASPQFVAIDATSAYWTSGTDVLAIPLGGGVPTTLAARQNNTEGIAVDSANIYWSEQTVPHGLILKLPLDGGALVTLAGNELNPVQLIINETDAYWYSFDSGYIGTVPLAGGTPRHFLNFAASSFSAIALDSANIYYTQEDLGAPVVECPLDGGTPVSVSSNNGTDGVVSDGVNIYYTSPNGDSPVYDGALLRIPVAGGAMTTLATGGAPGMVVIDAVSVYWLSDSGVMKLTPR